MKTAVDQTTSTIPVAVLVPLCRRTLSGQCIKVDDIKSAVIFNMIQIKLGIKYAVKYKIS